MPQRYTQRILSHIADARYEPSTVDELLHDLNISNDDAESFTQAIDQLLDAGQVISGSSDTIALPPPGGTMIGTFRRHEKGFGFLMPDELTEHGDLFIPPGSVGDAMSGDRVKAKVIHEGRRAKATGKSPYVGRIIEVMQRAEKQYAGTLVKRGNQHLVEVNGRVFSDPVLVRDVSAKNAKAGDKVVIDLTRYPDDRGRSAEGVIIEVLGEAGEPDVETLSVMRAYSLEDKFPAEVLEDARQAAQRLEDDDAGREDLTDVLIATIDPPDAKDYDDAISITRLDMTRGDDAAAEGSKKAAGASPRVPPNAAWELAVHIADVAHYIKPGTALEQEAYARGNSTYLPRKVLPMLPEVLSNGVCSLQEGVKRYAKTCFITYDAKGNVLAQRFARTIIKSAKRLTYLEAQALIDDDIREARKHTKSEPKYPRALIQSLKLMDELAKIIRERRMKDGMIVLGLPEVELEYDDTGRVIDAHEGDDAFTHKLIEAFMVEANEAAARTFHALDVPMIRRVHPDPDAHDLGELRSFARVAGYNIPARPSRQEMQTLLESVRGKPAQHAVHMAVLKTLSKAEYSPVPVGHFALASEHYTHFTSPIRRYPDLVVHRALDVLLGHLNNENGGKKAKAKKLGKLLRDDPNVPDEEKLHQIGRHCSTTERNSEAAERELRNYLVLELLSNHLGEDFAGTVTGVTGQGIFVQIDRYVIDGFIRSSDLPSPSDGKKGNKGDRWQLNRNTGALVAQRSGRSISIGHTFTVRIAAVDLTRRQMELVIVEDGQAHRGKPKQDKPRNLAQKTSGDQAKPKRGGSKGKPKKSNAKRKSRDLQAGLKKKSNASNTLKHKKHRGKRSR